MLRVAALAIAPVKAMRTVAAETLELAATDPWAIAPSTCASPTARSR